MKIGRNEKCLCGSGKKYKKCCMQLANRTIGETLERFFGKKWLEKRLDKVKLDGFNDTNPMNLARLNIHPVIEAIVGTQMKLLKAEQSENVSVAIGKGELLQELLHKNLTILEPLLDVDEMRKRLRDKKEFSKVEYELAIAAGYKRIGYGVSFIKRSAEKRTGEFYISTASGNTILVECKKKDMVSETEKQCRIELLRRKA